MESIYKSSVKALIKAKVNLTGEEKQNIIHGQDYFRGIKKSVYSVEDLKMRKENLGLKLIEIDYYLDKYGLGESL